jgi:phage I-like protein
MSEKVEYPKHCNFSVDCSMGFNESNVSDKMLILEHTEKDDYEYKNGMLAWTLSEKKLKDMVASFKKNVAGRPLYFNYDHESNGSTISAGRIAEVFTEKTVNGVGLFAKVEWTPKARKHIEDKEYNHASIECNVEGMVAKWGNGELAHDFKIKKSVLLGAALTNDPFFVTTNLSLSNNENTENKNEDSIMEEKELADLKAQLSKLELDKKNEVAGLMLEKEKLTAKNLSLSKELDKLKLDSRNSTIASFVSQLPEDEEKRDAVKLKLEKMAEKIGIGEDFTDYANLVLSNEDKRISRKNFGGDLNLSKDDKKDMSVAEFAELQHKLQYGEKGE